MPFVPLILVFAWQVAAKSASFALGWATGLFFGQVPGNKGRSLSIVSLLATAWTIIVVGVALPLLVATIGHLVGWWNVDMSAAPAWQFALLAAGVIGAPPALIGFAELAGFEDDKSLARWLRRIPVSYPIALSLGASILQMVVLTPILALARRRKKLTTLQVPLVIRGDGYEELVSDLERVLSNLGEEPRREALRGIRSWPLRTLGFAARYLLHSVVRGDPARLCADRLELYVYATNVGVVAPDDYAYRVRAAIEKELAFSAAFLTWSEDSQAFEEKLKRLHARRTRDLDGFLEELDRLQERIDAATLKSDEWNVLYRLRLQIERDGRMAAMGQGDEDGAPSERRARATGPRRGTAKGSERKAAAGGRA
jgi:hypothetical protein